MTASNVNALRRRIPRWFVPCVCLPLLLLTARDAAPTPHRAAITVAAIDAPPAPIAAAPVLPAPAPVLTSVHVVLTRGQQRLEIDLPLDGKVSADTADAIARLMRCPDTGRTRRIATGTLALLADVAARFPGHEIEVVSAVRGEPERKRGVKHSKHWSGHAIDLIVRGATLSKVRDAVWKNHRDIGVGWYPQGGFIHIDYRPDIHDTAWTQPRKNADNIYHPRWARLARADDAEPTTWHAIKNVFASVSVSALVPSIAKAIQRGQLRSRRAQVMI